MTNLEIKAEIDKNNEEIKANFDPTTFVLNERIDTLIKRNRELQFFCRHEFVYDKCVYCGLRRNDE